MLDVDTHSRYAYNTSWVDVVGKSSMVFQVKACSDVHLALARIPGEAQVQAYEVVIGGWENSKSVIRSFPQQMPPASEKDTPGILKCGEFVWFWVSWLDGKIRLGTGQEVGEAEVMSWTHDTGEVRSVHSVGLSTGTGHLGRFRIQYFDGQSLWKDICMC